MVATKPIVMARDFIVRNPSASNEEVARQTGVSLRTVSSARKELRDLGLVKPAYGDRGQSGPPVEVPLGGDVLREAAREFDVQTQTDLEQAVRDEMDRRADEAMDNGEVNIAELKKTLWKVMHRNTDDRVVVAAASALARIQAEADSRPLGPGKPMTRAAAMDRLIMLFKACGVTLVVDALNKWTGEQNEGKLPAVNTQTDASTTGVTQAPGSQTVL